MLKSVWFSTFGSTAWLGVGLWLGLGLVCGLSLANPVAGSSVASGVASLRTQAEASAYLRTGRYDEVVRLCGAFAAAYPTKVRCQRFGDTPEGRPMLALIASADGVLDAETARARNRPVVLAQGGIHAGEIEGKDAGFAFLRQLLTNETLPGLLTRITWVFVPVFNIDGHERFGPYQRPNQRGPVEMGWRVTAQNLNLNRDYVKAEAPEMAAMLALLRAWDPILYIDLHTTDGADFQPDVAVMIEPRNIGPVGMRPLGAAMSQRVMGALGKSGHLPLDFYPSFVRNDEPSSGFARDMAPPRFSTGYWPLWNRYAVLVETHSWKTYPQRVKATFDCLSALLLAVADDGPRLLAAASEADRADLQMGGTAMPLEHEHGPKKSSLRFPGYAYVIEPSAISGNLRVRYDPQRPELWDLPFYGDVLPRKLVTVPTGGYIVPPAYAAQVAAKLRLHGLRAETLSRDIEIASSESFRVTSHRIRPEPYESRHTVEVQGAWSGQGATRLMAGSLYVPTAQRGASLVVHLLEPTGPESLLAWGFLSGIFEQKEYMEDYVAESVAEKMLSLDAALRSEFLRRLREEPAFAQDPKARLNFFVHHHPSFDTRMNLYPILRVPKL